MSQNLDRNPVSRPSIISMDFMRICAAMLVVIYHYFYYIRYDSGAGGMSAVVGQTLEFDGMLSVSWWGWVGVYVFFVVSGFVITLSARGKSARDFAIGRFTRLYPALLFFATCALLVILVAAPLSSSEAVARWVKAIVLFPRGPWIDGAIWTLTVEVVFYFLVFLIIATNRFDRLPRYVRLATFVTSLFWLAVFLHAQIGLGPLGEAASALAARYFAKFFLLTTGSFFLLGMLLYEIFDQGWTRERTGVAALATLSSFYAIVFFASDQPGVTVDGQSALVPAIAWLLFIGICTAAIELEKVRAPNPRYRKAARSVGLMTYPLYLINQITGAFIIYLLLRAGMGAWGATLAATSIILVLSYSFAVQVEPRMRRAMEWALAPIRSLRLR